MVKKKLMQLREKQLQKKEASENAVVPRITNENVAEHREEILSGARKYIYPLQHSKHRIVVLTVSLVIATVLIFFSTTVFLLYRRQSSSAFLYQVTKVLPFPVARSGNTFIAYENYLFELRHYIHYYETQQQLSFETEAGADQLAAYKKRALDDVVNLAYTKQIAEERGVSVTGNEVDEQIRIAREQKRFGSNEAIFEDVLRSYWNWSINDFRRSLSNELLVQKVTRSLDEETEKKAGEAYAKLVAGADFAEVAKQYSDEEFSRDNGGEFGEVDPSNRNVSQQTVDTLLRLPVGQFSEVKVIPYETGYALEIVKNLEKTATGAKGAHIIFRLKDLAATLNDRKEQHPYRLYIKLPE
ncbi:peptidylprolyl isomerase [Candidatus Saccharibacteria bacterium]|nr:peptidylprolyl isomerase [Candidatus Saccharibacteria bacterium]